jgi:hypothetical protein
VVAGYGLAREQPVVMEIFVMRAEQFTRTGLRGFFTKNDLVPKIFLFATTVIIRVA